ncbi:MAG: KdsC family phosphatase [Burkholderiaceae bacterium]
MNLTAPMFTADILHLAAQTKMVFFDVDGVLTDGGIYIGEHGEVIKRFHVLDGHGIQQLQRAGLLLVVISGRDSAALRVRLSALGLSNCHLGAENKYPAAQRALDEAGFTWAQAAAIGDDWPDLPVLRRCGFSCAPPNAHSEVIAQVDYVTAKKGGEGAAREFCDLLLHATGHYEALLQQASA